MYVEIANIRKQAIDKIKEFELFIKNNEEKLIRTIIFVETKKYGLKVQELLLKYNPNFNTYYGEDNPFVLKQFSEKKS